MQRRNRNDFHLKKSATVCSIAPAVLQLASSRFSCSSAVHKGDDVIFLLWATWPACRHCLHTVSSALPTLEQLGRTVCLELNCIPLAAPCPPAKAVPHLCALTHSFLILESGGDFLQKVDQSSVL